MSKQALTCGVIAVGLTLACLSTETGPTPRNVDAGVDAGPGSYLCSPATQNCGAGEACMPVDAGLGSLCLSGACDIVRQTGCDTNQKCAYISDGGDVSARGCTDNGTQDAGEMCGADAGQCQAGLTCVAISGEASTCQRFCYADSDCGAGLECNDRFLITRGTIESPSFCVPPLASCDLLNTSSCTGAGDGLGCYPGAKKPACYAVGTAAAGATCQFANDCVPGAVCAGSPPTCRQICRASGGAPACPSTAACLPTTVPGATDVGLCSSP